MSLTVCQNLFDYATEQINVYQQRLAFSLVPSLRDFTLFFVELNN
jgi:hypothetical protein